MPLNYSKWDNLELSDDSDIEEHPNVDKKSMIRWKQREIHEKREQRKMLIAKLRSELSLNSVLRPRIQAVINGTTEKGVDHYRSVQRRLKEAPSDEKPNTGASNQPTYDQMLSQLLEDVWRDAALIVNGAQLKPDGSILVEGKKIDDSTPKPQWSEGNVPENKKERLGEELEKRLNWHVQELGKRDEEVKKEIEKEEKEQNKKITSDGIHEGFSATTLAPSKPSPLDDKPKTKTQSKKEKVETIEVLNPKSAAESSTTSAPVESTSDTEEDEESFGPLTPSARAFAQIPLGEFEKSYAYIQKDSSVLTESTHDSLLAEAFDAERRGDKALAKRCVHQSLLINYCRQLGRDGVGLFFQKMITRNPKSIAMFSEDFTRTYDRIATRTVELIAEEEASGGGEEREQIQLVAEDPTMEIGFNIPDGPPPDDLRLEGEGTEEMDIEQVKAFLTRKWEIFQSFPQDFKEALKKEKLDDVNKVLAKMKVSDAEEVVELLQEGGMLSFSEKGVRDMTK